MKLEVINQAYSKAYSSTSQLLVSFAELDDDTTGQGCASDHSLAEESDAALLVSSVAGEDGFRLVLTRLESNVWTGPDEVRVEIERDGEVVADESYAPKYVYSQRSGGRGCPQYWVLMGDAPVIGL